MKLRTLLLLGSAAVLLLGSCAAPTPQVRIQSNPELFAALPPAHKELVTRGQLARGMSPEAVFLAWGRADNIYEGIRDNTPIQRWDYISQRPVQTTSFFGAYGFGRYGARGYGFGAGPEITYIPYRSATVWFDRDRVTSWERLR